MKILVTGGTGFVGSNLTKKLISEGHKVWITGSENEAGVCPRAKLISWDSAESQAFDVCFHQAANNDTLDSNTESMIEANIFRPASLFNSLSKNGCKKFVYASSTAVYGNKDAPYKEDTEPDPLNIYAKSKLAFDEFAMGFAEENRVDVFGLRYCNVYGPGEAHKGRRASMIMQLMQQMISGQRPRVFKNGEQKRDWIYVDDVVEANLAAMKASGFGIFNVAGGKGVSFNRLIEVLNDLLGLKLEAEYIECNFQDRFQTNTECDISKAKKRLAWSPQYDIESGVARYLSLLGATL